jgi:predicted transposase YdaD
VKPAHRLFSNSPSLNSFASKSSRLATSYQTHDMHVVQPTPNPSQHACFCRVYQVMRNLMPYNCNWLRALSIRIPSSQI